MQARILYVVRHGPAPAAVILGFLSVPIFLFACHPIDDSNWLPLATFLSEGALEIHDSVATSVISKLFWVAVCQKKSMQAIYWCCSMYTSLVLFFSTLFFFANLPFFLKCSWHLTNRHATRPVALEPTYNPTLLKRAPSLAADKSHLLDVDGKYHPIHINLIAANPSPLSDYVQRIEELSNSSNPSALLAPSYVRYLGDHSGGHLPKA